jgi:hypothetical protein
MTGSARPQPAVRRPRAAHPLERRARGDRLVDLWLGGVWVAALAALAAVLMLWELHRMVTGDGRAFAPALVLAAPRRVVAVFVAAAAGIGWGGALPRGGAARGGAGRGATRGRWMAAGSSTSASPWPMSR